VGRGTPAHPCGFRPCGLDGDAIPDRRIGLLSGQCVAPAPLRAGPGAAVGSGAPVGAVTRRQAMAGHAGCAQPLVVACAARGGGTGAASAPSTRWRAGGTDLVRSQLGCAQRVGCRPAALALAGDRSAASAVVVAVEHHRPPAGAERVRSRLAQRPFTRKALPRARRHARTCCRHRTCGCLRCWSRW
jgi:hypothetical protein